jgi:hypothetical protein
MKEMASLFADPGNFQQLGLESRRLSAFDLQGKREFREISLYFPD